MRTPAIAAAIVALALGLPAHARQPPGDAGSVRYRWTDARGLPHFSDSLSDDAIRAGYDVLDGQGMVVQHVLKPLTPPQRAAAERLAAQRAAEQRIADQRERDDQQLLASYPDTASYKAALQQALDNLDQQIDTTRINLRSQEQALSDLLDRAADLENAKKPVPPFLTGRIAEQRQVVAGQRATLARQQGERDAAAQRQARQLQHYVALKAAQSRTQDGGTADDPDRRP